MVKGKVHKIQQFSLDNGPGIRTTLFLKGCPLRCIWCGNPELQEYEDDIIFNPDICLDECRECLDVCLVDAVKKDKFNKLNFNRNLCNACGKCTLVCPSKALSLIGKETEEKNLLDELFKDIPFYETSGGGITISGGEPLFQSKFVFNLLKDCKKQNIHTALDTCGYGNWFEFNEILKYSDLILYDLKIINTEKHKKYTGVSNKLILDNLRKVSKIKSSSLIIRLPLIPGVNDSAEDIYELLNFLKDISFKRIDILPYHKLGVSKYKMLGRKYQLIETKRPEKNIIDSIKLSIAEKGFKIEVI